MSDSQQQFFGRQGFGPENQHCYKWLSVQSGPSYWSYYSIKWLQTEFSHSLDSKRTFSARFPPAYASSLFQSIRKGDWPIVTYLTSLNTVREEQNYVADRHGGKSSMLSPFMVFLIALSVVLIAILLISSKILRTVLARIRTGSCPWKR